jgi:hypothetical protein
VDSEPSLKRGMTERVRWISARVERDVRRRRRRRRRGVRVRGMGWIRAGRGDLSVDFGVGGFRVGFFV